MKKRRYPTSLFFIGLVTNIMFRFSWLFVPGIILLIVGIFFKPCLWAGIAALAIDLLVSLIDQLRIRKAFFEESDSPDFVAFQDALSKDGNWMDNLGELLNQKISNPDNLVEPDCENEEE